MVTLFMGHFDLCHTWDCSRWSVDSHLRLNPQQLFVISCARAFCVSEWWRYVHLMSHSSSQKWGRGITGKCDISFTVHHATKQSELNSSANVFQNEKHRYHQSNFIVERLLGLWVTDIENCGASIFRLRLSLDYHSIILYRKSKLDRHLGNSEELDGLSKYYYSIISLSIVVGLNVIRTKHITKKETSIKTFIHLFINCSKIHPNWTGFLLGSCCCTY